jgi:Putative membrane protein insertion efficiency factor
VQRRFVISVIAAAGITFAAPARAHDQDTVDGWDVWEAEDLTASSVASDDRSFALGPINELMLAAIAYYQVEIGPNSISRCPYLVSCSVYASHAIGEYGLFGLPIFFDRYFFRENADTFTKYPRYILPSGVIRYDDAAFRLP